MSADETKAEVFRMIGPVALLMLAMERRALKDAHVLMDDGTTVAIRFKVDGLVVDWGLVNWSLKTCSENVRRLELVSTTHTFCSLSSDFVWHDCTATFNWNK